MASASAGCGECTAACGPTVLANVTLPNTFDPNAPFAGTSCVGSVCGDFAYPAPFGQSCVTPSSATEGDIICLTSAIRDGVTVNLLHYTFNGPAQDGETVYLRLTDPSGTTTLLERTATLTLERSHVCGHSCATQTFEL